MTDKDSQPVAALTAERLRQCLSYDPDTGVFNWLRPSRSIAPGGVAGYINRIGYRAIRIDDRPYYAHRLAWLYVHGVWPTHQIDHINGERADNRIVNLRSVGLLAQAQNRAARGTVLHRASGKWISKIGTQGKIVYLGTFTTEAEAHAAYVNAKRIHHPGFVAARYAIAQTSASPTPASESAPPE